MPTHPFPARRTLTAEAAVGNRRLMKIRVNSKLPIALRPMTNLWWLVTIVVDISAAALQGDWRHSEARPPQVTRHRNGRGS